MVTQIQTTLHENKARIFMNVSPQIYTDRALKVKCDQLYVFFVVIFKPKKLNNAKKQKKIVCSYTDLPRNNTLVVGYTTAQ